MKLRITLLLCLLPGMYIFGQNKNTIAFQAGFSCTSVYTTGAYSNYNQDVSYRINAGPLYQLSYSRAFSHLFSLEGAIVYSHNKVQTVQPYYGEMPVINNSAVNIVSVPVYAKFSFLSYIFIYGGLSLDQQTNSSSNDLFPDQSGFSAEAGIGGKYNFRRIVLIVNGFIRDHATFYIGTTSSNNSLVDEGIKLGIGYTF